MSFPQWDTDLFLSINGHHCPLMDSVMWTVSGHYTFVPLYLLAIIWMCRKEDWRSILCVVGCVALCILLTDRISSGIIKPAVERLRPSHEPSLQGLVHVLHDKRGGLYGFVSSHAANHFAMAMYTLLWMQRRWYSICIMIVACAIGYSRIYLGVHYPLDVLCGAAVGMAVGASTYKLQTILITYLKKRRSSNHK